MRQAKSFGEATSFLDAGTELGVIFDHFDESPVSFNLEGFTLGFILAAARTQKWCRASSADVWILAFAG